MALVNDAARRLLGLPDDAVGRPVAELDLTAGLVDGRRSAGPDAHDERVRRRRVLVVNQRADPVEGRGSAPW